MILFCQSERKVFFNPLVKVHIVKHRHNNSYWWSNEDYYSFKQHAIINKIYSQIKQNNKKKTPLYPSPVIKNKFHNPDKVNKEYRRLPLIRGIF